VALPEIVYTSYTHLGYYFVFQSMEEGDFVLDKANGDKLILFSKLGTPCDE